MKNKNLLRFPVTEGSISYECRMDIDLPFIDSEMDIYCQLKKGSQPISISASVPHRYSEDFSILDTISPLFYAEEVDGASFTEIYDLKFGYYLSDVIFKEFDVNLEDTNGIIPKELIPQVPYAIKHQKKLIVSKIKEFIEYKNRKK